MQQLEGTVKFDQGQIDNAKLQIDLFPHHRPDQRACRAAPVDPGNIIHATDTNGLARDHPTRAHHGHLHHPRRQPAAGARQAQSGSRLPVEAFNREQTKKLATGHLLTLDNQIDPNSGTVRFQAEFPNKDHIALPQPVRQCPPAAGDQARGHGGARPPPSSAAPRGPSSIW